MRALLLACCIMVGPPASACLPRAEAAFAAPDPVAALDAALSGLRCDVDALIILLEARGWDWTGEEVALVTLPGGIERDAAHHFCRPRPALFRSRCERRLSVSLRDGRVVRVGPFL
ncbi:hypothetical protein JQC91_13310 [Jannaschia sp. Os4]|uniref:hypothetical protein n=1 Tax=Jannaschia sp. Os4 TaxID=2807617 RepID=UPI00193A05E3|nr:hypothetical protein [Jannaschia sp. Os4]MBM2577281.1 hypothetical protein [Jannaschia sp. Os4]